ncbi:MAG: BlaI/MecI/CopY family transcriptional regulator [Oscillospiraceae bacterium]|jgi:BlaI family penicillinase repressor|nr:BlaI/MecI/CopY family transcriptional regulator [Oscillospiraceae bacterium]
MSGKPLSLSAAEWQIMECLWEHSPRTLMEIVRALTPATGWSKSTIVTMVTRLEAKGALRHTEGARARLYSPTVLREQAALQETESLLRRVYRGSVGLLVNTMADGRGLTEEDLQALSAILERARGEEA